MNLFAVAVAYTLGKQAFTMIEFIEAFNSNDAMSRAVDAAMIERGGIGSAQAVAVKAVPISRVPEGAPEGGLE